MLTRAEPHGVETPFLAARPRLSFPRGFRTAQRSQYLLVASGGEAREAGLKGNWGSGPLWSSGACLGPGEGGRAQRPEGSPLGLQ